MARIIAREIIHKVKEKGLIALPPQAMQSILVINVSMSHLLYYRRSFILLPVIMLLIFKKNCFCTYLVFIISSLLLLIVRLLLQGVLLLLVHLFHDLQAVSFGQGGRHHALL